jgi:hypothetical protein
MGVLTEALQLAVPLWIDRCQRQPWHELQARSVECVAMIAEHGDELLFGGRNQADAFNRLAEGIAILAFAPGGISVFGLHFEAEHGVRVAQIGLL